VKPATSRHPRADVTIRLATRQDADAIAKVFRNASLSNDGDREALLAHPDFLEWPGDGLLRGATVVATTASGDVIGFAGLQGDEVPEVEDLFVDPAWMRQGVATRLIERLCADVAAAGGSLVEVTANPHALEFYRSAGFVECGEVATELGPGLRMRRWVTPPPT